MRARRRTGWSIVATLWTVGHSTHSASRFQKILEAHEIEIVADVRRFPGSRRLPQFSQSTLESDLAGHGIAYCWLPQLGGRRSPAPHSPNTGWRHRAFRAYADHTASEEFAEGLFELLMLAEGLRTVVMCAEVLWWRCHRRLIADAAVSLGVDVIHIRDTGPGETHRLAPPARLRKGILTYPSPT
jgi:uncharacterized protein (DUF488 family)